MKKTLTLILVGALLGSTIAFAASKFFSDVPANTWYTDAVDSLSEKGIIEGYPDGTFGPSNNVNRAELAVILDRLLEYVETGEVATNNDCYKKYSGNLTPLLVASFEYPCTWTVPLTGGKVSSPDETAVLEYPAPDVGLPNQVISEGNVTINGKIYSKTIYKNDDIFVEYIDLGTIEDFDLDILFHYKESTDKNELYHVLETFTF